MSVPTCFPGYLLAGLALRTAGVVVDYHILAAVDPYPCYWSPFCEGTCVAPTRIRTRRGKLHLANRHKRRDGHPAKHKVLKKSCLVYWYYYTLPRVANLDLT